MSWVQWQGETLPMTKDDAELQVTLSAPDTGGPRQRWRFHLGHCLPKLNRGPNEVLYDRVLTVEIAEMGVQVKDWRELAGLTIRTTPQWLAQVEECDCYGQVVDPSMEIHHWNTPRAGPPTEVWEDWTSVEYELRLGKWDGGFLGCEIDAWAVPKSEFRRLEPETPEELARFAEGPPHLRVITRAKFDYGWIEMERCGDDPVPLAIQRVRQSLGSVEVVKPTVRWTPRYANGPANPPVTTPGWRSTVSFQTGG